MKFTINKIARLAGITLKTLRHYEKVGILVPKARSDAGYRLYSEEDVERLQQILFFRELDFSLVQIKDIMNNPSFERKKALEMQIQYLEERSMRYTRLSQLARKTLMGLEGELKMRKEEMFEGFDYDKMIDDQKKYESEVKERWGESDAYRISKRRTDAYTKEDWLKIQEESSDNLEELILCFKEGEDTKGDRMMNVCNTFRSHITKFFYPCSLEMYSNLGNMYIADERFTMFYDKHAEGLASYYNEAIQYYCITKA